MNKKKKRGPSTVPGSERVFQLARQRVYWPGMPTMSLTHYAISPTGERPSRAFQTKPCQNAS